MKGQSTSERSLAPHAERPKVIYVMGAGHSGSTILGVTLGNCTNVFYAGEVEEWLMGAGVPHLAGPERTRFWSIVRDDVDGAAELFGSEVNRSLERSSAAFRVDRWPARRRLRRQYRRVAEDLYRAIARAAGETHIVDTSHFPLRARELQKLSGIDLYLVFLVRNPHGVVASNTREINRHEVAERRFRTFATNADLWLTHLLSVFVFLTHRRDRRIFVRHEDFLADPERVLRRILECVDSSATIPNLASLRTGLPFHGNRLIGSGVVALKREASAPVRGSPMTTLLQLPWAAVLARLRPAAAETSHEGVSALRSSAAEG